MQFKAGLAVGAGAGNAMGNEQSVIQEAFQALGAVFELVQEHFVYHNLDAVFNATEAESAQISREHQKRGLSVVLAAVQGNTTELWHILLYEFLYLHYIAASCYIDLLEKKQQAVRDCNKAV